MSAGVLNTVVIGKESTWGTAVAPAIAVPVHFTGGIQTDIDNQVLSAARGHLAKNYAAHAGKRVHEGDLEMDLYPETAGYFLRSAFGGVSSALKGGETIVYEHSLSESETKPSYTIEQAIGSLIYRYAGAIVKTLKLSAKAGETAQLVASILAKSSATGTKTTAASPIVRPFNFKDVSVKIATVAVPQVESFELEYTNNIEFKHSLAGSVDPQYKAVKGSEVKGKLECFLDTNTAAEFANMLAGTTRAIDVVIAGDTIGAASTYGLEFSIPKASLTAVELQITEDYNMVTINFEGLFDDTTSKLLSGKLTNLTAAY